jgi:hypothetical protein
MVPNSPLDHKIEPEYLGPLADRPLAEKARSGGPADLFPGSSAFLSQREQRRRREQWNAARPLARRLLKPEEHVLYVARAIQVPPVLHAMALGALALSYHQVVLVFTDRRIIEVLLGVRGKTAGTRLRSYPWASVRDLKFTFSKLTLAPAEGRKQAWKVPVRGDKKLLKLLLPRLKQRLLQEGAARAEKLPLWHCPQCGATVPANPASCNACRASFRSSRLAAFLSLAFPGAGLFYAGHPVLGTMDFLGEVLLYGLFLLMMLEAKPGTLAVVAGVGVVLFLMTKLESAHLSQILTSRSSPETEARRSGYRRFGLVGGLMSLVLIGGAFPLAGAVRPVVDRDLDAGGTDSPWQVSRKPAEWEVFADDDSARSQWQHPSGLRVTLFAYPQGVLENTGEFRNGYRDALHQQGVKIVKDDAEVPAPFSGFRFVTLGQDDNGQPVSMIHYFVEDRDKHDLHQAVAAVRQEDGDFAEQLVGELLSRARFIGATPPERTSAPPAPAR